MVAGRLQAVKRRRNHARIKKIATLMRRSQAQARSASRSGLLGREQSFSVRDQTERAPDQGASGHGVSWPPLCQATPFKPGRSRRACL